MTFRLLVHLDLPDEKYGLDNAIQLAECRAWLAGLFEWGALRIPGSSAYSVELLPDEAVITSTEKTDPQTSDGGPR